MSIGTSVSAGSISFGPPVSGSLVRGSAPGLDPNKNIKKNLDFFTFLVLLSDFVSLKNDVNVVLSNST